LITLTLFGLATFTYAAPLQDYAHKTKSEKVDHRYNANKYLNKDGTMDIRYKLSKKAAAKGKS